MCSLARPRSGRPSCPGPNPQEGKEQSCCYFSLTRVFPHLPCHPALLHAELNAKCKAWFSKVMKNFMIWTLQGPCEKPGPAVDCRRLSPTGESSRETPGNGGGRARWRPRGHVCTLGQAKWWFNQRAGRKWTDVGLHPRAYSSGRCPELILRSEEQGLWEWGNMRGQTSSSKALHPFLWLTSPAGPVGREMQAHSGESRSSVLLLGLDN